MATAEAPARIRRVQMPPRSRAPYRTLDPDGYQRAEELLDQMRERLAGKTVSSVTFLPGGGLEDLLSSVLSYLRDGGINARWLLLDADGEFGSLARRLYNALYGSSGDGGPLGEDEAAILERVGAAAAEELAVGIRPGDVVALHDPPTAGLIAPALEAGARVIWRCNLGVGTPNDVALRGRVFLLPLVEPAHAYAFTRAEHAWPDLDRGKLFTIPPSLDPLSVRNRDLSPDVVLAILDRIGLTESGLDVAPTFIREDGSPQRVDRVASIEQDGHLPEGALMVAQVASWELLKDAVGTLDAFVHHCRSPEAHLVLVGPDPDGRREEQGVVAELGARRERLSAELRRRVHIVSLPVQDRAENAAMVNAIQRRADVIAQKALAEGFGLSVTEAMWKARPVVATGVGGIKDQIVDGESGVLIPDPHDLSAFGEAIESLLTDPERRQELGMAAQRRVGRRYLTPSHIARYLELIATVLD